MHTTYSYPPIPFDLLILRSDEDSRLRSYRLLRFLHRPAPSSLGPDIPLCSPFPTPWIYVNQLGSDGKIHIHIEEEVKL
jgi:hypothetical protein